MKKSLLKRTISGIKQAITQYSMATERRNTASMKLLADVYRTGDGVKKVQKMSE
jgi:hypothetical protein